MLLPSPDAISLQGSLGLCASARALGMLRRPSSSPNHAPEPDHRAWDPTPLLTRRPLDEPRPSRPDDGLLRGSLTSLLPIRLRRIVPIGPFADHRLNPPHNG